MKNISFILFLVCSQVLFAQIDSSNLVKYSPDFKFKDGIYLDFEQVKTNTPIPKSRIITNADFNSLDFFEKVLNEKTISYFDKYGSQNKIETENIWGYCRQGVLFIYWNNEINRIPIIGKICHFVSNETVYHSGGFSPYSSSYYYDPMRSPVYPSKELRQYIIDFDTGKIMEYNKESLKAILMRDTELYEEFNSLKRRKQKKMKYLYLRKYNLRNPLYFRK